MVVLELIFFKLRTVGGLPYLVGSRQPVLLRGETQGRKSREGSWTGRDVQPVLSSEVLRELSSFDAVDLMSRSRRDERFWYNCKQGLDCSQGDIQVISREVDGNF